MSHRDYEEFLALLNENKVKYLIIEAHAVAFHAYPRATKDLDLFVEPTQANAKRVLDAIREFFGGSDLGFTAHDLTNPESIIQLGLAPIRIDIVSSLSGIPEFKVAWERRIEASFGSVEAFYLSLDDLIREKESAGRNQDKADLDSLLKARRKQDR